MKRFSWGLKAITWQWKLYRYWKKTDGQWPTTSQVLRPDRHLFSYNKHISFYWVWQISLWKGTLESEFDGLIWIASSGPVSDQIIDRLFGKDNGTSTVTNCYCRPLVHRVSSDLCCVLCIHKSRNHLSLSFPFVSLQRNGCQPHRPSLSPAVRVPKEIKKSSFQSTRASETEKKRKKRKPWK